PARGGGRLLPARRRARGPPLLGRARPPGGDRRFRVPVGEGARRPSDRARPLGARGRLRAGAGGRSAPRVPGLPQRDRRPDALGGSSAAVLMPGTDDLRLAGLHGLPAPLVRFLEQGLTDPADPLRTCARRRRVLAAPQLVDDDRFDDEWRRVMQECGYNSLLAAPVETPRSEEGALVLVFFAQEHRFADDDLELARNLTGAARGALERSALFA